ncbi:MAG: hypothetical protein HY052_09175 [Proteobacteria bacterium]|nr:hypothetical protein [Pseudomonadota bacterium]
MPEHAEPANDLISAEQDVPPEFADDALALRFVEQHGHKLRYIASWGQWFIYDGSCWEQDKTMQIFSLVRGTCRSAAAECESRNNDKNNARIAVRLASKQTVYAVENLARADRRVAAVTEQFDADPWLLNTPGGTVDLRTGIIRPHRVTDHVTKITAVAPGGNCPVWYAFLQRVTGGDADLQTFLQRMAGYALTGVTTEQALFFLYGLGGNGKGVFLNTLTAIMRAYAAVASMDVFTDSKNDRHPTDMAMLRGARLVTAQETEDGRRWAESKIKVLTGSDPITARFMRQDFFTFVPQFKLVIAGNHKPGLRNVDKAIRRRFNLVPFTVTISDGERDKDLPEKLKAEWSGILQWAIEGATAWHESGLAVPAVVMNATAEYLEGEDAIERWIKEGCIEGNSCTATVTDLYLSWTEWCKRTGEYAGSQKRFISNIKTKRPALIPWQCPVTRRTGFQGLHAIKQVQPHWSDPQ